MKYSQIPNNFSRHATKVYLYNLQINFISIQTPLNHYEYLFGMEGPKERDH